MEIITEKEYDVRIKKEQRFEAAKAAMQGILSNKANTSFSVEAVAVYARESADVLLAELERTEKK